MGVSAGHPGGFTNEVAKTVFEEMGYKVELVPMEFSALINSLKTGRIDAAGAGLYITPPRCEAVAFAEPIEYDFNAMAVKKGNPHHIQSNEDIANTGVNVGVETGSDSVRQAEAAGVKETQISTYQDVNTALEAITSGRVDVVPYDNVTLETLLKQPTYSGLEMTTPYAPVFDDGVKRPYGSAIAFQKDNTELAKKYSEKQTELFKEGTKVAAIAKDAQIPDISVPKGVEPYKAADYCAHKGS